MDILSPLILKNLDMAKLIISPKSSLSKFSFVVFPLLYLFIISIVGIIVVRTGLTKISGQRSVIKKTEAQVRALKEKVEVLGNASAYLPDYVSATFNALPSKNSALTLISQFKDLSDKNSSPISDFDIGISGKGEGVNTVNFSYIVEVERNSSKNLIKESLLVSPIMVYNSFDIKANEGAFEIEADGSTYWAVFPEKIPSVTDRIVLMKEGDNELISSLMSLRVSPFGKIDPSGPYNRDNPFIY